MNSKKNQALMQAVSLCLKLDLHVMLVIANRQFAWAFGHMQTAKLQASLRIHAVSPEKLLFDFTSSTP